MNSALSVNMFIVALSEMRYCEHNLNITTAALQLNIKLLSEKSTVKDFEFFYC
jgi:hypothetical protein